MIDLEGARFECGMIGAIGNKFNKTQDLNVMNWEQAMMDNKMDKILEEAKVEHEKFLKYKDWKAVNESEAMPDEIIDTTVAVKTKPTGTMRVTVVGRGFKQKPGKQFKDDDVSAPVIS